MQAGFILLDDGRWEQGLFDRLFQRFQLLGRALPPSLPCPHTPGPAQQVFPHFTGPFIGQPLLWHQADGHCPTGCSRRHGCTPLLRKGRGAHLLTCWAPLLLGLMLDHPHPLERPVQHLAALHLQALPLAQIVLRVLTRLEGMDHPRMGVGESICVVPSCPGCPPAFLPLVVRKLLGCPGKRSEDAGRWLL
jgi:hypothetical protein